MPKRNPTTPKEFRIMVEEELGLRPVPKRLRKKKKGSVPKKRKRRRVRIHDDYLEHGGCRSGGCYRDLNQGRCGGGGGRC